MNYGHAYMFRRQTSHNSSGHNTKMATKKRVFHDDYEDDDDDKVVVVTKKQKVDGTTGSDYTGLPMFKVIARSNDEKAPTCRRLNEIKITLSTPQSYGKLYYFNPDASLVSSYLSTVQAGEGKLLIETLGALETYGYKETDKYHPEEKRSSITVKIPTSSQTYRTLKMFEDVVARLFKDWEPTWKKKDVDYPIEPFLKDSEYGDFAMMKVKIDRSKKDDNIILAKATRYDSKNKKEVQLEGGIEGIKPMSEIRLLLQWQGFKLLPIKKVYHNLSLRRVCLIRSQPEETFSSEFDPSHVAP